MICLDLCEEFGPTATDDDLVALGLQRKGKRQADAARGSGDENGVSGDMHDPSLHSSGMAFQGRLIGGSAVPG
jgi:hypothetical protein